MELKKGMYVRYKKFSYSKEIKVGKLTNEQFQEVDGYSGRQTILKASYNIIDLIEVGDYVNGKKVGYIDNCEGAMREYYYDYEDANVDVGHWFEEIETIVTKEQFSQMEYKVDDAK